MLQQAREQTYTLQNIKGAWAGAGLVPYNKRKIQSMLSRGIIHHKKLQSPIRVLKTPKQSHEFRQILEYSEQLVLQDGPKELLLSALEKLSKSGIEAKVQEAVAKHETAFLKKRLNIKATYQKSRVRMTKEDMGYAKIFTQNDVNAALEQYEVQQKKLAEAASRRVEKEKKGKGGEKKGKGPAKQNIAPPTASAASGSGSRVQVLDSED